MQPLALATQFLALTWLNLPTPYTLTMAFVSSLGKTIVVRPPRPSQQKSLAHIQPEAQVRLSDRMGALCYLILMTQSTQ